MNLEHLSLSAKDKDFIRTHQNDDVRRLVLQKSGDGKLDIKKLAIQIKARQRAESKLPAWVANPDLVFPASVPVEQASSEQTARYKARLVAALTPEPRQLLDGTGGMGVDAWAFATVATQVIYVERDPVLAQLAAHNLPLLGAINVQVQNAQSNVVLHELTQPVDWIYLDPARRDNRGERVIRLEDCEPNVVAWWPMLQAKSRFILLKTSPLVDLEATIRQLPGVRAVHVVAVRHEVKEVLLVAGNEPVLPDDIAVTAIDLIPGREAAFTFRRGEERAVSIKFATPRQYLYEPNAAILKAGAFRIVAERFGMAKLAAHSHLYTSDAFVADFPGRAFRLVAVCKPSRTELQTVVPTMKANLTVRNFPQSVEELRKKLGLKEGGDVYVFATTLENGDKRLVVCRKPEEMSDSDH